MDLLEILYTKASNWRKKNQEIHIEDRSTNFLDNLSSIELFFNYINPENRLLIRPTTGMGFVSNKVIYFPNQISFLNTKELNKKLYLHKALVASVIFKEQIYYPENWNTNIQKAYAIYRNQKCIQKLLEQEIPNYSDFFSDVFQVFQNYRYQDISSKDFSKWTSNKDETKYYNSEQFKSEIDLVRDFKEMPYFHPQKMRSMPSEFLMFWMGLISNKELSLNSDSGFKNQKRSKKEKVSEIEGRESAEASYVDLNKKKEEENLIMHSFEKLNTVEDYSGGLRKVDDSDELNDQENAMKDLQMSSITRSEGGSSSVYKGWIESLYDFRDSFKKLPKFKQFTHCPEWDYKAKKLKKDHCRLYLNNPEPNTEKCSELESSWISRLKEEYTSEILSWKRKIEIALTEEKLHNRSWEGVDLDLNAYVNFYANSIKGNSFETPLFFSKKKYFEEVACVILFDQSFSTDSWIKERRILDIELESIGLISLLLDNLKSQTMICSTWSETRNHCYLNIYKNFSETWNRFYNISPEITPHGYTRLGPAIRHSQQLLFKIKARRKMLILLTDGKPTDYDRYEGRYGIEDIHQAINFARSQGVIVKALAVEKEATYHFPLIFGNSGYYVLNDPTLLPEKLWKIYLEAAKI